MFAIIQTMLVCGTALVLGFVILLSLPQSQLRAFLLPIVSWTLAIFCAVYCLSPLDLVPEAIVGPLGMIDDVGAIAAGIAAARTAMNAGKKQPATQRD